MNENSQVNTNEPPVKGSGRLRKKNILIFSVVIVLAVCASIIVPKIQASYRLNHMNSYSLLDSYTTNDGKYTVSLRYYESCTGSLKVNVYLTDNDTGETSYIKQEKTESRETYDTYAHFKETDDGIEVALVNRILVKFTVSLTK